VSEARSINRAEILTVRTDTAAEVAEVFAPEAAAAEAAAAVEAVAAAEAAAAGICRRRGGRCKSRRRCAWRGSGFGARAAE
jgi:predicted transglutaminase-like cysteine proteinase